MAFGALGTLLGNDVTRWWLALRCRGTPMRDYYRVDYATLDTPWHEVEFLAVDLETTGLDPKVDSIVSFGWVPIIGGAVRVGEARHRLVRTDRPVTEESAVLHGILDDHLAEAPPLEEVLPDFLDALTGRVPVAHHAPVEVGFLGAACRRLYGCPLEVPFVDTLDIERRLHDRSGRLVSSGEMRLQACRARYNLPRYRGHHALVDALACAELLLAQASHMDAKQGPRLDSLLG